MQKQPLLHRAEEHGQSRPLTINEVGAYTLISGLKGLVLGMAGSTIFALLRGLTGDLAIKDIGLSFAGFAVTSFGWHLLGDMDDLKDGLRQYRNVETYAPPASQPEPAAMPASPIVVRPYGGEPYILRSGDERPALPDGRNQLGLNPETLAVVLREVLSQHDGQWSRSRLMAIRVGGQRITRTLYEQMTDALCKAGFLQERSTGGYSLPPTVETFEDLHQFFPRLPGLTNVSWEGGRAGGKAGGREGGPSQSSHPPGGGVGTLAERRRQRWIECSCDVRLYKEGDNGH